MGHVWVQRCGSYIVICIGKASSWVVLPKVGQLMEGLICHLTTSGDPGLIALAEELASLAQNTVFVIKLAQHRQLTDKIAIVHQQLTRLAKKATNQDHNVILYCKLSFIS